MSQYRSKFFLPPSSRTSTNGHVLNAAPSPQNRHEAIDAKRLALCSQKEARRLVPHKLAQRLNVLPLGLIKVKAGELLTVACEDAADQSLISILQFASSRLVKLVRVEKAVLAQAIHLAYGGDDELLYEKALELKGLDGNRAPAVQSGLINGLAHLEVRSDQSEVTRFLAGLLDYAVAKGASDLHLVPLSAGTCTRMRVDGELLSRDETICSLAVHAQLVNRIKVLAGLDISIKSLPQDGSFTLPMHDEVAHVRVSIMPTVHGEKVVLRLNSAAHALKLSELRLPQKSLQFLKRFMQRDEGALILSGPTGSGKTTTMYSVLNELACRGRSVVTVEDPVEMKLQGVAQTSVDPKAGLSYEVCLKSMLRQDPDVIMVGELRDRESAEVACRAALTGHMLLSTVHARSSFEVFLRLFQLGVDRLTVSQAVRLVVCQRLVALLCRSCKVIDLAASNRFDCEIFKPVGCQECDYTGFKGRELLVESLVLDEDMEQWVLSGELCSKRFFDFTAEQNYQSLKGVAEEKLKLGLICMNDYLRFLR